MAERHSILDGVGGKIGGTWSTFTTVFHRDTAEAMPRGAPFVDIRSERVTLRDVEETETRGKVCI